MSATNNGGPAFPTLAAVGDTALSEGGLTVRDYFAAKAMQAMIDGALKGGLFKVVSSIAAGKGKTSEQYIAAKAFESGYTLVDERPTEFEPKTAPEAWLLEKNLELSSQLTRLQILARGAFREWNKSGDVHGAMHTLFREAGGIINLDEPPKLTIGPATQAAREVAK